MNCPQCGCQEVNAASYTGVRHVWYRCRDCGWDWVIEIEEEDENV